ncbi:MAG TPA: LppP/LprE family lipoprotein [Solirubrobacteraceae bacterium]|nr:LppP/LprE family lipoprotein [Solirubrobacteraceae bacterium]
MRATRRRPSPLALLSLALSGAALALSACGGGTKTVTVSEAPAASQTGTTAKPATTQTTTTSTTPAQTQTSGTGTTGTATTRSAPEPKFTEGETQAEGVRGAATVVRAHGYTPNDTSEYHSDQALRVMVGTRTGSADGYQQQAFFFVNDRYLGTDTKLPSASVKVVSQGDTEVTLGYALYRPKDPLVNPSGGEARVTFQLNNGKLTPLGTIPPANSSTGLSRQ